MEDTKTKKNKRNIWQKLNVIENNLAEAGNSRNAFLNLAKEQECLVCFTDDIIGDFCKSVIHLIDIDTGEEVIASGIASVRQENFTAYSRTYALKALLGCFNNQEKLSDSNKTSVKETVKTTAQSPTPARMPSEPNGGVPKNFTKFDK